jgi:hypothetical protein
MIADIYVSDEMSLWAVSVSTQDKSSYLSRQILAMSYPQQQVRK